MTENPKTRAYRGIAIHLRYEVDPDYARCSDRHKKWSIAFPDGDRVRYSHGYITLKDCTEAIDAHIDAAKVSA